jgi:hypothetical protein
VSRLPSVYRRIREALDSEWTLTVIDDDPEADASRLEVRSLRPGCKVRRLREAADSPVEQESPRADVLEPGVVRPRAAFDRAWSRAHRRTVDDACVDVPGQGDRRSDDPVGEIRPGDEGVGPVRVHGCLPDLGLEYGVLYDSFQPDWVRASDWLEYRTRPFEVPLPAPPDLPEGPEHWLDRLASRLRELPTESLHDDEARPYTDVPMLLQGRTFLEFRGALGRALHARADYRELARERIDAGATEALDGLREDYRTRFPDREDDGLLAVVYQSPEGQRILGRAANPRDEDLVRHLAGWLGDVPAHELFARWEAARLALWLEGESRDDLVDDWTAVRDVFRVPSRARVLALLGPVRDPSTGAVGFWRVLLPRPSWLRARTRGWERHPEWGRLPLDLIPDLPLGYWLVSETVRRSPALRDHLASGRYRVTGVEYELLGKPGRHGPLRGFENTRVRLHLDADGAAAEVVADVRLVYPRNDGDLPDPRLRSLDVIGDPALGRLFLAAHP